MRIHVTQERLERNVTVGELLALQSNNLPVIINVMARFVIGDDGQYLTQEEGKAVLLSMTIADMREAAEAFNKKMNDAAVPPLNASDSNEPISQEQPQPQTG